jgi:hypothetical protein
MEEPGAEGDSAAVVMRDDMRAFEAPIPEQVREHLRLEAEVDGVRRVLR